MVIEYTRGDADKEIKGFDFTAYRWTKHKDTLIIHNLWEIIIKNSDEDFDVYLHIILKHNSWTLEHEFCA